MHTEAVTTFLESSFQKLERSVEDCVSKLKEYRRRVIMLEMENDALKKQLSNANLAIQQQPEAENLSRGAASSEIEVSLTQLKELLNLRKR
jgi:regulator of replication initiation timing